MSLVHLGPIRGVTNVILKYVVKTTTSFNIDQF